MRGCICLGNDACGGFICGNDGALSNFEPLTEQTYAPLGNPADPGPEGERVPAPLDVERDRSLITRAYIRGFGNGRYSNAPPNPTSAIEELLSNQPPTEHEVDHLLTVLYREVMSAIDRVDAEQVDEAFAQYEGRPSRSPEEIDMALSNQPSTEPAQGEER